MTISARPKSRTTVPARTSAKAQITRLGHVASTLAGSRRRDAEALVDAGRRSYAGVAAIVERRIEILQATASELRAVGQVMRQAGARESLANLDALALGALQLTLNSIRELSGMAATTQKEAFEILVRRLQDNLAEFRHVLTDSSEAHKR